MFLVVPLLSLSVVVGTGFGIWAFGQQGQPSGEASGNVIVTNAEDKSVNKLYVWFGDMDFNGVKFTGNESPDNKDALKKEPELLIEPSNIVISSPLRTRAYITTDGVSKVKKLAYTIVTTPLFDSYFDFSILNGTENNKLELNGELTVGAGVVTGNGFVEFDPLFMQITYKANKRPTNLEDFGYLINQIKNEGSNSLVKINLKASVADN